jgi:hypothetical protein
MRLNELGYLAGPLTGIKGDQTKRAIRRYTYALPMAKANKETDDEMAEGAGVWIQSGENARKDLVETPEALTDRSKSTRILLDHDRFVVEPCKVTESPKGTGEANTADGHAIMEAKHLDRFDLPFKVTPYLVSKNDHSGRGEGVLAPEAVGAVKCEWHVYDPPEDLTVIGAPFTRVATSMRTTAPAYLQAALAKTGKGKPIDPLNGNDNCPVALGGVRPDDPEDMTPYFAKGGLQEIYPEEVTGKKFLTRFNLRTDNLALKDLQGTSGALFRGSYIAGDNWIVQARLSFAGLPNEKELVAAHQALPGLETCFGSYAPPDPLAPVTGKMPLWRRQHVVGVLDWWSNPAPPPIDWDIIVAAFRAAHVVLIPPSSPLGASRPSWTPKRAMPTRTR